MKKIPEGQSAFVFTDKRIETLGQEFPVLPASIQWQLLSFPLDSQTWQAHGIRGVLEGQSNSRRTSFKQIENRRDSLTLLLAGTHPEELIPLKAGLTSLAEEMEIPLLLLDATAASSFPISSKKASWGIWLKQEPISEDFLAALAPEAPVLTRTLDRQSSAAAEAFIPLFGAGQETSLCQKKREADLLPILKPRNAGKMPLATR